MEISNRLTALEQSRPSSRQSGSRRTSRQSSRATSPNPDPYSLNLPSGVYRPMGRRKWRLSAGRKWMKRERGIDVEEKVE